MNSGAASLGEHRHHQHQQEMDMLTQSMISMKNVGSGTSYDEENNDHAGSEAQRSPCFERE